MNKIGEWKLKLASTLDDGFVQFKVNSQKQVIPTRLTHSNQESGENRSTPNSKMCVFYVNFILNILT